MPIILALLLLSSLDEGKPVKDAAGEIVELDLTGTWVSDADMVKVAVNDVDVYERAVEPTNQRLFGLFHYTDRTEARVRSMVHRGAWPKQRPADDQLFELKK